MIVNPDILVIESLAHLENDHRFIEVKKWLEDCLAHTLDNLVTTDKELEVRREQGAARDLREVLNLMLTARHTIQQAKDKQKRQEFGAI